jgi:8-oxo-dGTP diphosphatase
MRYVLVFIFNDETRNPKVLLIKKNRPDFLAGKLNGIGGKVEELETYKQAAIRETLEEAGIQLQPDDLSSFGMLCSESATVMMFAVQLSKAVFSTYKTMTDEELSVHRYLGIIIKSIEGSPLLATDLGTMLQGAWHKLHGDAVIDLVLHLED